MLLSAEQNGDGTDPTYFGTLADYTSDMNMSFILPTDVRYNINANGWNGYFLPTYAYTAPFAYESHDIGYKLTVGTTVINELEANGFVLSQNSPNPFNTESSVNYQLSKNANTAFFTVTDVTGRIISVKNIESSKGVHSVKIDNYSAGLYYYSLNVDGKIITKKMIVN